MNSELKTYKAKVKINIESFNRIKQMLSNDNEEDRDLAIVTLKGIDTNSVILTLLGKDLYNSNRHFYVKEFKDKMLSDDLELEKLYPVLKKEINKMKKLGLNTDLEKKLVNDSLNKLIISHLLYDGMQKVIKSIDIKLKW